MAVERCWFADSSSERTGGPPVKETNNLSDTDKDQPLASTIASTAEERDVILDWYREHPKPNVRLRCPIILLLAGGHTWAGIWGVLFCSTHTISRWKGQFEDGPNRDHLGQAGVGVALRGLLEALGLMSEIEMA